MKRQAINLGATVLMCAVLVAPAFAQEPTLERAETLKNAALIRVATVKPDFQVQRTELHRVVDDWALVRIYPRDPSNPPEDTIVNRVYGTWIGVGGPSTRFAPSERAGAPEQLFLSPGPYSGQDLQTAAARLDVGTKTYTGFGVQFDYPENATVSQQNDMLVVDGPESSDPTFQGPSYEIQISRAAQSIETPLDDWGFEQMQREIILYNGYLTKPANWEGPFITPRSASYYQIGTKNVWQIDWSGGDNTRRQFYLQAEGGGPVARVQTNIYPAEINPDALPAETALAVVLQSIGEAPAGPAGVPSSPDTVPPVSPSAPMTPTAPITGTVPPQLPPAPPPVNLPIPFFGGGGIPNGAPVFSDPATPIAVTAGQVFVIELESNPSTGYSWQLTAIPDLAVARFVLAAHVPDGSGRPGASGVDRFAFRAIGVGTSTISLAYLRPWETDQPPAKTAEFTIIVTPK